MDQQQRDSQVQLQERQWSTFLQKPKRPTPKPKTTESDSLKVQQ